MRQRLLQLRTNSALKRSAIARSTVPFADSRQIGIIFTVDGQEKHQLIKQFVTRLQQDGKQVQVLEFLPKRKENPEFKYDFFTIENLNFWGKIDSVTVAKFIQMQFDYLFVIDTTCNALITHVLATSRAHCRVGRYDERSQTFLDFMIETDGSIQALIDHMLDYAKRLK